MSERSGGYQPYEMTGTRLRQIVMPGFCIKARDVIFDESLCSLPDLEPRPFPRKEGQKSPFYELTAQRLSELLDPANKDPHGNSCEEPVVDTELELDEDGLVPGEYEFTEWESRSAKNDVVIRIQQLQKELKTREEQEDVRENDPLKKEIMDLKDLLILRDTGLIYWCIKRFGPWDGEVDREVLFNSGVESILKAIAGYKPERGIAFTTYEVVSIKNNIRRAWAQELHAVTIPENQIKNMNAILSLQDQMMQELGRNVSLEEAAKKFDTEKDKDLTEKALNANNIHSLDEIDSDDNTLGDTVACRSTFTPENAVLNGDLANFINEMLIELSRNENYGENSLTFHEVAALSAHFGLKRDFRLDYEEISEGLGMDRAKIPEYVRSAIIKIRKSLFKKQLQEYR